MGGQSSSLVNLKRHWLYLALGLAIGLIPALIAHDWTHYAIADYLPQWIADPHRGILTPLKHLSDVSIALAYLAISGVLAYVCYTLEQIQSFRFTVFLFASFIVACGATHAIHVLATYYDLHTFEAMVKYVTAVVSVGTAMTLPSVVPRIRLAINESTDNARQAREDLESSEKQTRVLVGKVVEAEQNERTRLAYDVHDGPTQTAVAAHQQVAAHAYYYKRLADEYCRHGYFPNDERIKLHTSLSRIEEATRQTVNAIRSVIDDLRPTELDDYGLPSAIQRKVDQYREKGMWQVVYDIHMPHEHFQQRPIPEVETALYRVFLEALTNIQKHALASHVHVILTITGVEDDAPTAQLIIEDNGIGYDPNPSPLAPRKGPGEKVGLNSMRERVRMLGGDLTVDTAPGQGTRLTANIPF